MQIMVVIVFQGKYYNNEMLVLLFLYYIAVACFDWDLCEMQFVVSFNVLFLDNV